MCVQIYHLVSPDLILVALVTPVHILVAATKIEIRKRDTKYLDTHLSAHLSIRFAYSRARATLPQILSRQRLMDSGPNNTVIRHWAG